jgi:hypothetical protein
MLSACLRIVVLSHIAEGLNVLTFMGWVKLNDLAATAVGLYMKFKVFPCPVGKLSRYPYRPHQMVKIFFLHHTNLGDYGRD